MKKYKGTASGQTLYIIAPNALKAIDILSVAYPNSDITVRAI